MISVREALTRATGQLSAHSDSRPTALADAALLLRHVLGIDRPTLIAHPERPIDRDQQAAYQRLIERRLTFEPVQYITGSQEFFGLNLRVTPAVLIPRPETELLVETVLSFVNPVTHSSQSHRDEWVPPQPLRIADIGTGSGAIALALAQALPPAEMFAVDLSETALAIAHENALTHGLAVRIRFLRSDLLTALAAEPPFDIIVSNPPYVPLADAPDLHPQVREHEPATALFGGDDGLDIYRRLIPQAAARLRPAGLLALEIGHGQQAAIVALLAGWDDVEFVADLQGIPRVVTARLPSRS